MNGPRRLVISCAIILSAAVEARAQLTLRPTPRPAASAETEQWYQNGQPVMHAGDLYYPAGAQIHFNGNEMVLSGSYEGVPLYSRPTIEPLSIVYVPLSGGLMQPFERRRAGVLAGTAGSTAPSFPVASSAEVSAGVPPRSPTPEEAPAQAFVPAAVLAETPAAARSAAGTGTRSPANFDRAATPNGRSELANGVSVEFDNERWFSSGPARPFDAKSFTRVGEIRGLPVYTVPGSRTTIFVRVAPGVDRVAPYSKRDR
jgi:hypothetical protein